MKIVTQPSISDPKEIGDVLKKGAQRLIRSIISIDTTTEKFEGFFEGYLEDKNKLLISHLHESFFDIPPSSGSVNFIFDSHPYFFRFLNYEKVEMSGRLCISLPFPTSINIAQNREFSRFEFPLKEPIQVVMFNPVIKRRIIRNLIDISYLGISFKGTEEDALIPNGTNIGNVVIFTDEIEALTTNTRLLHKEKIISGIGETYYKMGMAFLPVELDSSSTLYSFSEELITDKAFITDCFFSIYKGNRDIQLKSRAYFSLREVSLPTKIVSWDKDKGLMTLAVTGREFPKFIEDFDRLEFSAFGGYFWSRVFVRDFSGTDLIVQIPDELHCHRHRWGGRLKVAGKSRGVISFKHPLFGTVKTHEIYDISTKGLSFIFDKYSELYMEGLYIQDAEIEIENLRIKIDLSQLISYSDVEIDGSKADRASIKFISISDRDFNDLFIYVMKNFYPNISFFYGSGVEMWKIYERFKFIHERKRKILEKDKSFFNEILRTMDIIHSPSVDFYKNFIVSQDGEVKSSGSMMHIYENTWLLQHLISDPGEKSKLRPASIFYAMVDYMINHPEVKYIKVYFRPENRFPRRLFADFSERHPGVDVNTLESYKYYKIKLEDYSLEIPSWVNEYVSFANDEDILTIQNYFVKNGVSLVAKSDDFIHGRQRLERLDEIYRKAGLFRQREILVAKRKGEILAFSSLEHSSPGLNLSLILSAFRVFEVKRWADEYRDVFRALILKSLEYYKNKKEVWGICMIYDSDSSSILEEMGFVYDRTYLCWTLHRQVLRAYYYYILYLLGRFQIALKD